MNFCSNCGTKLEQEVQFCPECGKQLKNPQEAKLHEKLEEMIEQEVAERVDRELAENDRTDRRQTKLIRIALAAIAAVCLLLFAYSENVFVSRFSENAAAIEEASASVVKLYCFDSQEQLVATGSGFVVFDDDIILTNFHVIEGEVCRVYAERDDGLTFMVDAVVAYDAKQDIALLRTQAGTGLEPLKTGSSGALQRGENLVAIGSPLGLLNTVSTGVFSGYVLEDEVEMLRFTASISSGSSGGALFDDRGRVIGITTATYVDGQNLNLGMPIESAQELWNNRNSDLEIDVLSYGMQYKSS